MERHTEHHYIELRGYPQSITDDAVTVFFARTIDRRLLKEMKLALVPVVEELRAEVRCMGLAPVALYVLDGRQKPNHVPSLEDLARCYRRLLTYTFAPVGLGLLHDPAYGDNRAETLRSK